MSKTSSCEAKVATAAVNEIIPEATLTNDTSGEMIVNLPESRVQQFPDLFHTLEKSKEQLGVASFGLSVTTMEDVFLR